MTIYSEETLPVPVGQGIDSYNHPVNIQDGFCPVITNFVAKGDRLVTRKGFKPPLSIDTRTTLSGAGHDTWYTRLSNSPDVNWPVAIWGVGSETWMIRQFDRDNPGATTGDNMIENFAGITNFKGAVVYLDKIYILDDSGLNTHTTWNWGSGTTAETVIETDLAGKRGLFVFKDRMWCFDDTKIYYTDAPASPGAYPETWDVNGKFIHIGAGTGLGKIWSIIPIGTKLFVLTGTGFYNVSILGSPENWVVRLIDNTVQVNHQNCAYENQGIIYFVDTRGVWATNQDEVKLISEPIQDIFETGILEEYYYEWKLFPFDDGLLVCRAKVGTDGIPPAGTSKLTSEARLFYTKLDDIAWTEFTFNTNTDPGDVVAAFSNMETHHIWGKANYIVLGHGNSVDPSFADLTAELLVYDGYQDILRKSGASAETVAVVSSFTSKIVRGTMLTEKHGKYGYINYSCSGVAGNDIGIAYNWIPEIAANNVSGTLTDDVLDSEEGLVRIPSVEYFRHFQLVLTATLDTNIREYTILGATLELHTHRKTERNAS